jgi:hypothetical protein
MVNEMPMKPVREMAVGECVSQRRIPWRETVAAFNCPVMLGDTARWAVRATIAADVAYVYGMPRDQYTQRLTTLSLFKYPVATNQCLAALDELRESRLQAFVEKQNHCWNIPLNEALAQLAVDFPIPIATAREIPCSQFATLQVVRGAVFAEQPVTQKRKKGAKS